MIMIIIALAFFQVLPSNGPRDGVYSNEEEVYFAKEANRSYPPWTSIKIDRESVATIDAYGNLLRANAGIIKGSTIENCLIFSAVPGSCKFDVTRDSAGFYGMNLTSPDGHVTRLRLAREFSCWSALPKKTVKADGSINWLSARDLKISDQGGMAKIGDTNETGIWHLKIRNVSWPSGPNQPSLVLYIFEDSNLNYAVSYSWADTNAIRVGINLRKIQASCKLVK